MQQVEWEQEKFDTFSYTVGFSLKEVFICPKTIKFNIGVTVKIFLKPYILYMKEN